MQFDENGCAAAAGVYREQIVVKRGDLRRAVNRELLAAYGQNDLARQQIPPRTARLKWQGSAYRPAKRYGSRPPNSGRPRRATFAAEEILPAAHIAFSRDPRR